MCIWLGRSPSSLPSSQSISFSSPAAYFKQYVPHLIAPDHVTLNHILLQLFLRGLEGTLDLLLFLGLLLHLVQLLLGKFMPLQEILDNTVNLVEMIVLVIDGNKSIVLGIFLLGAFLDLMMEVLFLEVGWIKFLDLDFKVVIELRLQGLRGLSNADVIEISAFVFKHSFNNKSNCSYLQ